MLAERDRLFDKARKWLAEGKRADAAEAGEAVLAIERRLGEATHFNELARTLDWLADRAIEAEDFPKAVERRREARSILELRLGREHWKTVNADWDLKDARRLAEMTPEQRRRLAEAEILHAQATSARLPKPTAEAEAQLRRCRDLYIQLLGPTHPKIALATMQLALWFRARDDFAHARPLLEQALETFKTALGPRHIDTAGCANALSELLYSTGDLAGAAPLLEEAVATLKASLGPNNPETIALLENLGTMSLYQRNLPRARSSFEGVLAYRKVTSGFRRPETVKTLCGLGNTLQLQGDPGGARPLLEQALEISREVSGARSSATAEVLNDLALFLTSQGDFAGASPLYEDALAIRKESLGPTDPAVATSLNNLATLYRRQGRLADARPLYEEALTIRNLRSGPDHPETLTILNNLATLHHSREDYAAARPLYERVLAGSRKTLGSRHHHTISTMNNLAVLHCARGDFAEARPLLEEVLSFREATLVPTHPDLASCYANLGMVLLEAGVTTDDRRLLERAVEVSRQNLELAAASQSERQQILMLRSFRNYLDELFSFHVRAGVPADRLYGYSLCHKGAVLDRQRLTHAWRKHAAKDPARAGDLAELESVIARLSRLTFQTAGPSARPDRLDEMTRLTAARERLESRLAVADPEYNAARTGIVRTSDHIRSALPSSMALVDFMEYTHYEPPAKRPGEMRTQLRFLAFVVRPDQPVAMVELGPVGPIASAAEAMRGNILSSARPGKDHPGRTLRDLVWTPIEAYLDGVQDVLISPDGPLDRVPMAALPGRNPDSYLIEERMIAMVPVPRMLGASRRARPEASASVRGPRPAPSLLAIGDVAYDGDPGRPHGAGATRSAAIPRGGMPNWPELKATGPEIAEIVRLFDENLPSSHADVFSGGLATEVTFRRLAPTHRYLHIATHGYFAPPELRSSLRSSTPTKKRTASGPLGGDGLVSYNPGLLSGLVLAGANRKDSGPGLDDGILTALEVAELDLAGVDLAVLSACETGLGEMAGGEGLLGLQRAFQVAGARSVVASLWTVDDEGTRDLMYRFYRKLWKEHLSPARALRAAQLDMIKQLRERELDPRGLVPERAHGHRRRAPEYFWAAFVLSTDDPD